MSTGGYIRAMLALNADSPKNLDFFVRSQNLIPGANWNLHVTDTGISFDRKYRDTVEQQEFISFSDLEAKEFSQVQVVSIERRVETREVVYEGNESVTLDRLVPVLDNGIPRVSSQTIPLPHVTGTRTIRIIDGFPVSHSDMIKLSKASEPESICTGDQSFGEAVSMQKRMFYETLEHKEAFAKQISTLAKQISPKLEEAIILMESWSRVQKPLQADKIAKILSDPIVQSGFSQYSDLIYETRDLGRRIGLKTKRFLMEMTNPEVAQALAELEKVTKALFRKQRESTYDKRLFEVLRITPKTPNAAFADVERQTLRAIAQLCISLQ
jgi:hypothetical protein